MMNWKEIWVSLFGDCEWLGLNIGFWVSMAVVIGIVILFTCQYQEQTCSRGVRRS